MHFLILFRAENYARRSEPRTVTEIIATRESDRSREFICLVVNLSCAGWCSATQGLVARGPGRGRFGVLVGDHGGHGARYGAGDVPRVYLCR